MNHCAIQQSNFAACEEMMMRSYSSISDKKDAVICPKPRRLGGGPMRPLRWHQQDFCDSRSGADLLDIILTKVGLSLQFVQYFFFWVTVILVCVCGIHWFEKRKLNIK